MSGLEIKRFVLSYITLTYLESSTRCTGSGSSQIASFQFYTFFLRSKPQGLHVVLEDGILKKMNEIELKLELERLDGILSIIQTISDNLYLIETQIDNFQLATVPKQVITESKNTIHTTILYYVQICKLTRDAVPTMNFIGDSPDQKKESLRPFSKITKRGMVGELVYLFEYLFRQISPTRFNTLKEMLDKIDKGGDMTWNFTDKKKIIKKDLSALYFLVKIRNSLHNNGVYQGHEDQITLNNQVTLTATDKEPLQGLDWSNTAILINQCLNDLFTMIIETYKVEKAHQ